MTTTAVKQRTVSHRLRKVTGLTMPGHQHLSDQIQRAGQIHGQLVYSVHHAPITRFHLKHEALIHVASDELRQTILNEPITALSTVVTKHAMILSMQVRQTPYDFIVVAEAMTRYLETIGLEPVECEQTVVSWLYEHCGLPHQQFRLPTAGIVVRALAKAFNEFRVDKVQAILEKAFRFED
jgi:hypothetical protein